jgi:hypothetical protein
VERAPACALDPIEPAEELRSMSDHPETSDRPFFRALWLPLVAAASVLAAAPSGLQADAPVAGADRPSARAAAGPANPASDGPGSILGKIEDAAGAPLSGVRVTLHAAGGSGVLSTVLTDREGSFRLEGLGEGMYLVRVARLGYRLPEAEPVTLTDTAPSADLGVIVLEAQALRMTGTDGEGIVVHHALGLPGGGVGEGSATDLLRAIPQLEVDEDGSVRFRGARPAVIHLNGRPLRLRGVELATFLGLLPSDQVRRVEVIAHPSARRDPEGLGGVVNLVLR